MHRSRGGGDGSDAFKTEMVARISEPGASVSALAREIGISLSQLFGWRAAASKTDEVERAGKDEEAGLGRLQAHHSRTIEIVVNGMTVRAGATVCKDHLRRVLRAARSV
ncbi:transposase [Mesorhizobium sp. M0778]|uniref:transposase n=1 Tax=Mesorhizobium sp. M0778 TaxID=2956999 RepID=UPI00333807F7